MGTVLPSRVKRRPQSPQGELRERGSFASPGFLMTAYREGRRHDGPSRLSVMVGNVTYRQTKSYGPLELWHLQVCYDILLILARMARIKSPPWPSRGRRTLGTLLGYWGQMDPSPYSSSSGTPVLDLLIS